LGRKNGFGEWSFRETRRREDEEVVVAAVSVDQRRFGEVNGGIE
jgi:hypothetical protein